MTGKKFDASQYTREELKELNQRLSEYLGLVPKDLDIQAEIKEHYFRCKRIAEAAEAKFEANPSAMSSALNTVNSALKELSRQETDIYNAARAKALEMAIINTLKEFSDLAPGILDRFHANLKGVMHV
ncbi:hypothetical protein [Snodgrassella sp. ESL0324]|uniref:hypothetical protein n=1 Tax=Snodgrassella sp. ESL0324 TaxID=2705033 RepID=UPI00158376BB|nr:hypothetical protein [Snodgrassella sp. ESL0324]NUF08902.1 hypothetical protein [Snodgrassella sp. ESL0324]